MLRTMIAAAALLLAPGLATAQEGRVAAGEEITFTLDGSGTTRVTGRQPATPSAYESTVGAEFSSGVHDAAVGENYVAMSDSDRPGKPPTPKPAAGKIRVRFTQVAGTGHVLLVIENGYDRGLVYRAHMVMRDGTHPTDVCLVMPGKVGVEHWPYAIDAIEMHAPELVPWQPDDGIPCK